MGVESIDDAFYERGNTFRRLRQTNTFKMKPLDLIEREKTTTFNEKKNDNIETKKNYRRRPSLFSTNEPRNRRRRSRPFRQTTRDHTCNKLAHSDRLNWKVHFFLLFFFVGSSYIYILLLFWKKEQKENNITRHIDVDATIIVFFLYIL